MHKSVMHVYYAFVKEDAASNIEIWRKVRSDYKDAELNSINQATSINEAGVYYIGSIPIDSKDVQAAAVRKKDIQVSVTEQTSLSVHTKFLQSQYFSD